MPDLVFPPATNTPTAIRRSNSPSYISPTLSPVNMLEQRRRSFLASLNSRYIYGKIPLLHAIIFLCQMAVLSLLVQRFNTYYGQKPILTTMITNSVLGGVADTVAQSLTAIRRRANRNSKIDDSVGLKDFEKKSEDWTQVEHLPGLKNMPPPFDFERLIRFMAYGFLMAPVQFKWYAFLARVFPITKTAGNTAAFKRVALDQLIMAPMGLGLFFTFMTIAEGGGKRAIARKLEDVYVPALKANYMLWPAVQIINFRFMPIQFQIPFVSTIGIAWTAYLSLTNASDEA